MKNTKIIWLIAHLKIFLGVGQAWFIDFKYPILLAVALKVYFPNATISLMILMVILIMILLVLIGWFDLKFIHLPQTTAEINTRKYNPYFEQLEKNLNISVTTKKNGK